MRATTLVFISATTVCCVVSSSIQPGVINHHEAEILSRLAAFWRSECRQWQKDEIYLKGDKVKHNGKVYEAQWWTKGSEPSLSTWGNWVKVDSSCAGENLEGEWEDNNSSEAEIIVEEEEKEDTIDNNVEEEKVEPPIEENEEDNEIPLGPGQVPSRKSAERKENELTSSELFTMVKRSISTLDTAIVENIKPGDATNPPNVKRLEKILPEESWDYLFPDRHPDYSYRRFLQAAGKFPAVCGDYADGRNADLICRKTLATMFAHFTQETGGHNPHSEVEEWRQGLYFLREFGCKETGPGCHYDTACDPNTWQGKAWPCGKEGGKWKKYYGRGAKQLSYNFNYGPFSHAMFGDVSVLLEDPDRVASTWLNLASATWFYAYPQPPKPSMLHVIDGTWTPNKVDKANKLEPGFGATIMIINGGIECGHGTEKKQALHRQAYYKKFAEYFKLDITGEELSCAHMKKFSKGGSGSLFIYWDREWVKEYECKLVSYQTPYNALKPGDYIKCVEDQFKVKLE